MLKSQMQTMAVHPFALLAFLAAAPLGSASDSSAQEERDLRLRKTKSCKSVSTFFEVPIIHHLI